MSMIAAPAGVVPGALLPYIGLSYLTYEIAFAAGRARANGAADGAIYQLTMMAEQPSPQRTTVWFVGNDSAEANYFNIARSGYKFDANGRLISADWTSTTYRYRIHRVEDIDVDAIARAGIERSPIGGKASARVAKM